MTSAVCQPLERRAGSSHAPRQTPKRSPRSGLTHQFHSSQFQPSETDMLVLVIVLLAAWLILSVVGFVIEGLLWLGLIGVVLFVGTAAIGAIRR